MSFKEVTELRKSGKLKEAYIMAKSELDEALSPCIMTEELTGDEINIEADLLWPKRSLSWVLFEYLKQSYLVGKFANFIKTLKEIQELALPDTEDLFFEQLTWQVGKMGFSLAKSDSIEHKKGIQLFEAIRPFSLAKGSEAYSFLFKALHKLLKETESYIQFVNWWGFENFRQEDFQKEKMPNGKEVMAVVEQGYIAYAKHLLPKRAITGELVFDNASAEAFLPTLSKVITDYPDYQYPAYFNAKLLLALGENDKILESLLPFAKKKRNDFWVWEILAEVFSNEPEKVFACYCKALSCKAPEEMLVKLRQKMTRILVSKKLYREARTEIDLLVNSRREHGFKIPEEVSNWQATEWYENAISAKNNFRFYKAHLSMAESLLFSDTLEELIIVEFVNTHKKILNFIASEEKFGFFKYDRFLNDVEVGDILKVRFQGGSNEAMYRIFTAVKEDDAAFREKFMKEVSGIVNIPSGKAFGFIDDVFIHPTLVSKYNLKEGLPFTGRAMKTYNSGKKKWGCKLV
ncbi:hypothetical protein [uncultured Arcticibacterium sp.]|uniref:DUF7017 domain-containing protein n=1 Tax=uncultured Arcticibacterium sp. TaxID=2173042 RepID=UPI0030F66D47